MQQLVGSKNAFKITTLVIFFVVLLVFGGSIHKTETLTQVIDCGDCNIDVIAVTFFTKNGAITEKYLQKSSEIETIGKAFDDTICRSEGKYKFETFSGGQYYDISLYEIKDGKFEKIKAFSLSRKGELYYDGKQYAVNENANIFTVLDEIYLS